MNFLPLIFIAGVLMILIVLIKLDGRPFSFIAFLLVALPVWVALAFVMPSGLWLTGSVTMVVFCITGRNRVNRLLNWKHHEAEDRAQIALIDERLAELEPIYGRKLAQRIVELEIKASRYGLSTSEKKELRGYSPWSFHQVLNKAAE